MSLHVYVYDSTFVLSFLISDIVFCYDNFVFLVWNLAWLLLWQLLLSIIRCLHLSVYISLSVCAPISASHVKHCNLIYCNWTNSRADILQEILEVSGSLELLGMSLSLQCQYSACHSVSTLSRLLSWGCCVCMCSFICSASSMWYLLFVNSPWSSSQLMLCWDGFG